MPRESHIVVYDAQALARAWRELDAVTPDLAKPMEVIIRPYQPPRTGRQLAYYEEDVLRTGAVALGMTRDELHKHLMREHYAGHANLDQWLADPKTWTPRKREMSDFLTWAEAFLAEYGAPVSARRPRQALRWA